MFCMVREYDQIEGRFDPNYYRPDFVTIGQTFAKSVYDLERLGKHITDIRYGASVENSYVDSPHGVPLLRITDLKRNEIDLSDVAKLDPALREEIGIAYVREGDLLISRSGTIGIVAVVPREADGFAYGSFMIRFRVNTELLDPHYTSIICNLPYGQSYFERNTIGALQRNITIPTIKALEISVPPLQRQREIVTVMQAVCAQRDMKLQDADRTLDEIDTLIMKSLGVSVPALRRKRTYVASYSEFRGRLDPVFYLPRFTQAITAIEQATYPPKPLRSFIKSISGGATPLGADYPSEGVPFLRIQNIRPGGIDLSEVKFISEETHAAMSRSKLQPLDVLMTITGRVGTCAVVPPDFGEGNINQHIVRMAVRPGVNPHFISEVLNSPIGHYQTERGTTGTTRIALDYPTVLSIRIPMPPLEEQGRLAQQVTSMRSGIDRLVQEAHEIVEQAKGKVEAMILGQE